MAEFISTYAVPFPEENVPAAKKMTKDWLMQFARASIGFYTSLPPFPLGWKSRDRYENWKAYANGRQPVDKYKRLTAVDEDPTNNKLVVDWSVYPIIPKYRRIALGILEKQNYYLCINPIDPLATEEVEDEILKLRTKIIVREQLAMLGMQQFQKQAPLLPDNPNEPEDLDGLEAMELGIRHRTAMEVEQVVELVFNANNYEEIRRQYQEDLFDYGFACLKDYRDGNSVGFRRCDPRRMIVSYCTYPDFRDLKYVGEVQMIQANQVVALSNGQITKEDVELIWKMGNLNWSQYGMQSPSTFFSFSDFWRSGQLAVLDLEIYTTDKIEKEERTNTLGNVRFGDARLGENAEDVKARREKSGKYRYISKEVQQIYRVKWIVGTDMCYDYGKLHDIKRDPANYSCTVGSYHLYACSFFDMKAYSRVESLVPYADQIQLAVYKLQHVMNTAVPPGYDFNLDMLDAIDLAAGGSLMSSQDWINTFVQRGHIVHRSTQIDGQRMTPEKIVERVDTSIGSDISEFQTVMRENIFLIQTTLGLNELTDGSTPNPKIGVQPANLAAMATNNALSDLFYGDRFLTQSLAKSVVIRAQDIIQYGDPETFTTALGSGTVSILKSIKDIYKYIYSVSIEDKPDDAQLAEFNQQVQIAQAEKQITIADVMQLNNIQNLKQKEMFLTYRVKKNLERQRMEAMAKQQQNGQIQVQSAQAAEQAKQQTLQLEYQLKSQLAAQEGEIKINEIKTQGLITLEKERIAATGRVAASEVQSDGRDNTNYRDNLVKAQEKGVPPETVPLPKVLEDANILPSPNPSFSFLQNPEEVVAE